MDSIIEEKKQNDAELVGVYFGQVYEVDKHRFRALLRKTKTLDLELHMKIKRLNDMQKKLLNIGRVIKIDNTDGKLYFQGEDKQWY